jgi:uncharacterized protein (DUF433 family)
MSANSAIMSLVARHLSNPQFREEIALDRERALQLGGLDADARREFSRFDFQALESFGGLITKTQHNFLFEYLPFTRQLLRLYRLDLTVFSLYRAQFQSGPAAVTSRTDKTRRWVAFLESWLQGKDDEYPALAALLAHEHILWSLKIQPPEAIAEDPALPLAAGKMSRAIPAVGPGVRLAELRYNPIRIVERLARGGRPDTAQRRRCRLVYWIDVAEGQVRIAEPGRTVWNVLRLCDGGRSVAAMYRKLAPLPPATVRRALAFAHASGLIRMEPPK